MCVCVTSEYVQIKCINNVQVNKITKGTNGELIRLSANYSVSRITQLC